MENQRISSSEYKIHAVKETHENSPDVGGGASIATNKRKKNKVFWISKVVCKVA